MTYPAWSIQHSTLTSPIQVQETYGNGGGAYGLTSGGGGGL